MWWVLRVGSYGRWKGGNAEKAAKDLELREGEDGLSVFRVDDPAEADRVGVQFGMYLRGKPKEVDYVLIPEDAIAAPLRLAARPDPNLPAELGERHYEIEGLREEGAAVALARAALASTATRISHLRETEVLRVAAELVEEKPERASFLSQAWRETLAARMTKG